MAISTYNDFITADAADNVLHDNFYLQQNSATTALLSGLALSRFLFATPLRALPSLPGGKTYFVPTNLELSSSIARTFTIAKLTLMGELEIGTPTFTDSSAAPTITEGGVSRQIPSSVLCVVTTALNATPGNMSITYVDQNNNAAEATAAIALGASAVVNSAAFLNLTSPDWGVLDLTAGTRTGGTTPSGTIKFYHCLPLYTFPVPVVGEAIKINFLTDLGILHKMVAGDQLSVITSLVTAGAVVGTISYVAM